MAQHPQPPKHLKEARIEVVTEVIPGTHALRSQLSLRIAAHLEPRVMIFEPNVFVVLTVATLWTPNSLRAFRARARHVCGCVLCQFPESDNNR